MAVQREMEALQDAPLGLGVEVHQRVPADEQIEPRDGGVGQKVVAAEDDAAAQIAAEEVTRVQRLEVALEQLWRDIFDLPGGVARAARLTERFLVGVGRINLDAVPESVDPERFGEQHGYAVGLLPRGAAGGPYAHGLVRRLRRKERR